LLTTSRFSKAMMLISPGIWQSQLRWNKFFAGRAKSRPLEFYCRDFWSFIREVSTPLDRREKCRQKIPAFWSPIFQRKKWQA